MKRIHGVLPGRVASGLRAAGKAVFVWRFRENATSTCSGARALFGERTLRCVYVIGPAAE